MPILKLICGLMFGVLIGMSSDATAHPLAPSLLEVVEGSTGQAAVLWKTPLARVPGMALEPVLPRQCQRVGEVVSKGVGTAREDRWQLACDGPLVGGLIEVRGISNLQSNVILRVVLQDGRNYQVVLNSQSPNFVVPEHPRAADVFKNYLVMGVFHILTGWDHLLFVLGLILLVKNRKKLIWTITAFTVSHSVTLSLAALGYVHVWSAAVEALIAFSILVLAVELTRSQTGRGTFFHRYPWIMSFSFGLLHGLGFAGALEEVGLPVGEIPMALFSFSVGIEIGQLSFIAAVLLAQLLWSKVPVPRLLKQPILAVYTIGSLSAFWFLERISACFKA